MKLKTWKRLLTTAAVAAALTLTATVGASACTTNYLGGNQTEQTPPNVLSDLKK